MDTTTALARAAISRAVQSASPMSRPPVDQPPPWIHTSTGRGSGGAGVVHPDGHISMRAGGAGIEGLNSWRLCSLPTHELSEPVSVLRVAHEGLEGLDPFEQGEALGELVVNRHDMAFQTPRGLFAQAPAPAPSLERPHPPGCVNRRCAGFRARSRSWLCRAPTPMPAASRPCAEAAGSGASGSPAQVAAGQARDSLSCSGDKIGPSAGASPLGHASSARRRWEAMISRAGSGNTMA